MWIAPIFLFCLFALCYPRWRKKRALNAWYKQLQLLEHERHYQQLYAPINGFHLSKQARLGQDAVEYTYGEIDFFSFIGLLYHTSPHRQTVFYDLGSGTGKAVLACAMVFNVKKSCGVELFKPLHDAAVDVSEKLSQLSEYQQLETHIDWINNDFFNTDFSDADLVFINASTLVGDVWTRLNHHLLQLKNKTWIITTSKKLHAEHFTIVQSLPVQMSWGIVNAYIHQRLSQVEPNDNIE
jgi:hypothetical protein